jgi:hypothetical protein
MGGGGLRISGERLLKARDMSSSRNAGGELGMAMPAISSLDSRFLHGEERGGEESGVM